MDISSIIGLVGGISVVVFGATLSGSLHGLIDIASLLITGGGSYMCLYLTYPLSYVIGIFGVMGRVRPAAPRVSSSAAVSLKMVSCRPV